MSLFVQLFFLRFRKFLPSVFGFILVQCGSGAATLQESPPLFSSAGETFLLPTDLYFKKDLASPGYRTPDETTSSGRLLAAAAHEDPFVYDGYSPRSPVFVPIPCNLRDDLLPARGPTDAIVVLDISHRRSIPFHVRYRNHSNCGLVVQAAQSLDMDAVYAVVILSSYIWEGRLKASAGLKDILEDCLRMKESTAELERRASLFGLRPRDTKLALEALRDMGMSQSRILRMGVFAVRSRGGLYGPFFAIRERYLLSAEPVLRRVEERPAPGGGRLLSLRVSLRDPCGEPCRLMPPYGPGILAGTPTRKERESEISLLLRFPDRPPQGVLWIEGAEATASKNEKLMDMPVLARLSRDASVILAMIPEIPPVNPAGRTAAILSKIALSRVLSSDTAAMNHLLECATGKGCPGVLRPSGDGQGVAQLCFLEGDCTASAFLDPYVERAILPFDIKSDLSRPRFEDGALPSRETILKGYVRDLREDLFASDLYRKWAEHSTFAPTRKEIHVTRNIFSMEQYEELVKFVKRKSRPRDSREQSKGGES